MVCFFADVTIANCTVVVPPSTIAQGVVDVIGGGAVSVTGGVTQLSVTLDHCTFTNNTVTNLGVTAAVALFAVLTAGGAVSISVGTAVAVNAHTSINVTSCTWSSNSVTLASTGALPAGFAYSGVGGHGSGLFAGACACCDVGDGSTR